MNAQLATLNPLPDVLATPTWATAPSPGRRRLVNGQPIRAESLLHFNGLLARLRHFPLDRDQLATAYREVADQSATQQPASITQRLQLAGTIEQMLDDPQWQADTESAQPAAIVVAYVHGSRQLVDVGNEPAARFDTAILIDAAWPQLAGAVSDYEDYCRLRVIEAELRGKQVGEFAFTREDWQVSRRAEMALHAHRRRVAASSYLPSATCARFHMS